MADKSNGISLENAGELFLVVDDKVGGPPVLEDVMIVPVDMIVTAEAAVLIADCCTLVAEAESTNGLQNCDLALLVVEPTVDVMVVAEAPSVDMVEAGNGLAEVGNGLVVVGNNLAKVGIVEVGIKDVAEVDTCL